MDRHRPHRRRDPRRRHQYRRRSVCGRGLIKGRQKKRKRKRKTGKTPLVTHQLPSEDSNDPTDRGIDLGYLSVWPSPLWCLSRANGQIAPPKDGHARSGGSSLSLSFFFPFFLVGPGGGRRVASFYPELMGEPFRKGRRLANGFFLYLLTPFVPWVFLVHIFRALLSPAWA